MASLSSLSTELKLLIVECVDAEIDHPESEQEFELWKAQSHGSRWSCRRPSTTHKNILSLSSVNRVFRTITIPFIFRTVILRNTVTSAQSLQSLITSSYGRFVQRVEYLAVVDMPKYKNYQTLDEIEAHQPKAEDFPAEVEDVLANLSRFQNLDSVIVEFPWDETQYIEAFPDFYTSEDLETLQLTEAKVGWRTLMAKSYAALAKNGYGVVKKLALRNVVAKTTSTESSADWLTLLVGLEAFEVSFRGGNDGYGQCMSTQRGYLNHVRRTGLFFNCMPYVRDVHFYASIEGPVGIEVPNVTPFYFSPMWLPELQRLSLGYFFLSHSLVDFLNSHAAKLQSIRLHNVYVIDEEQVPEGEIESWQQFFEALLRAEPAFPELREFDSGWGFNYGTMGTEHIEDERTRSRFRLPYAFMDEDSGALILSDQIEQHTETNTGLECDYELAAYMEFRELVERNQRGASK